MNDESTENLERCKVCGSVIPEGAIICPVCGADQNKIKEEIRIDETNEIKEDIPVDEPNETKEEIPVDELIETPPENPEEPVLLESYPDHKKADHVIALLAVNQVNAVKSLAPWSEGQAIDVLVRRGDLEKAKEVLSFAAAKSKPMFLADIFSNTFTIAGKSILKNLIICSVFIPAGIIAAFFINNFFSSFYTPKPDNSIEYVFVETADTMDITREYTANGFIDKNLDAVVEAVGMDTNFVHTGDTLWVYLDEDNYKSYKSSIISIQKSGALSLTGDSSLDKHRLVMKLFEPDEFVTAGRHCEAEVQGESRINVIGVDNSSINIEDDDSTWSKDTANYVYLLNNGRLFKTTIETGIFDDDYTEVISGVSAGDSIVYSTDSDTPLSDGMYATANMPEEGVKLKNVSLNVLLLIVGFLLIAAAYITATIGVTKSAALRMEGEEFTLKDILTDLTPANFLKIISIWVIIQAVAFSPIIITAGFVVIAAVQKDVALIVIAVLLFIGNIGFAVYISTRWGFATVHTIVTGESILGSVKKSSELIKGLWWRTFGIVMLTSLVVNFVVSLVSTPFSFVFMWDYISSSMQNAVSGKVAEDTGSLIKLYKSMGWGFTLTTVFTYMLQCLIAPIFSVVIYYDLRIRKNDIFVKLKKDNQNNTEFEPGKSAI